MRKPDLPYSAPTLESSREAARELDRLFHAEAARLSAGLSPISLALAALDWSLTLGLSPGTAAWLTGSAQRKTLDWLLGQDGETAEHDPRFAAAEWGTQPWRQLARGFLACESWWREATDLRGMQPHHAHLARFYAKQWLEMLSPGNWPASNPEVGATALRSGGASLARGAAHWLEDAADEARRQFGLPSDEAPAACVPGQTVAVTPGQVVFRNHLIELIQYAPQTPTVQAAPVLIVPSWIMKYYILDLSPRNSMVRYLVSQGHTVFVISWRNPDENDAQLGMADYLRLGVFDALAAVGARSGGQPVQACGYCLGGTLLAIAAAAMAQPERLQGSAELPPLAGLTLLAAQVDFSEPGELGVFIDSAQIQMLEDTMAERGFLAGRQMGGSFQFLNTRDLVWGQRVRQYLLGEREAPNDLMAWNADVTRMPAAMHGEYLESLYLRNELAEGRFEVEGHPVALQDIRVPVFAVGTLRDHVSPWTSVYKLHRLLHTDISFALASGGHNAGIISEPGHPRRSYHLLATKAGEPWRAPKEWQRHAPLHEGSWWTAWHDWLLAHGRGEVAARAIDDKDALGAAPGSYVHVRYPD